MFPNLSNELLELLAKATINYKNEIIGRIIYEDRESTCQGQPNSFVEELHIEEKQYLRLSVFRVAQSGGNTNKAASESTGWSSYLYH